MDVLTELVAWFADPGQWSGPGGIPARIAEHLQYSLLGLLISAALAVPIGLVTGHTGIGGFATASLANFARALPTIGVLFLIVLLAGIGLVPVVIALVALAVPPILVNTHEGVRQVEAALKDAALGMGMRGHEVLIRLELPVAVRSSSTACAQRPYRSWPPPPSPPTSVWADWADTSSTARPARTSP